jgi:hypothetical protein
VKKEKKVMRMDSVDDRAKRIEYDRFDHTQRAAMYAVVEASRAFDLSPDRLHAGSPIPLLLPDLIKLKLALAAFDAVAPRLPWRIVGGP